MGNLRRKLFSSAGVLIVTPASFLAISVVTPGIASARCAGEDHEVRSTLVVDGTELVAEAPNKDTCKGNNLYGGHFAAKLSGLRAWVLIQNNGNVTPYRGSGYNTSNNNYSFSDNNSNSGMSLCVDDGSTLFCGWGTSVAAAHYPGGNTRPDAVIPAELIPAGINSGF